MFENVKANESERIISMKERMMKKASDKFDRIKEKSLTSIQVDGTFRKDPSNKSTLLSPDSKIKAFDFNKYSARKAFVPDNIINIPIHSEPGSLIKK
jgi:hypothetical protein